MASNKVNTQPGTIDDTVANLVLWGSRSGRGLARVDYVSEHSLRRCIQQVRENFSKREIELHEFRLPRGLTPVRLARFWTEKLNEFQTGVISITGFAEAFSANSNLEDELYKLNYYRELLAEPPFRQIWWMPVQFAERFLRTAPDLNSWFTKRLQLAEVLPGTTFLISYNPRDLVWAEWIAWQLDAAGFASRLQRWEFQPGQNFARQMEQATTDLDYVIAVISPSYLDSKSAIAEWKSALELEAARGQRKLLPIRIKECELPTVSPNVHYVDIVNVDETEAKSRLTAGIGRLNTKSDNGAVAVPLTIEHIRSPRFPNLLPRIWNIPHRRNPNFVGREELLAQLRSTLLSGKPTALVQAITGLGGVGKTETAVEYAYRHVEDFDVVWWIRCERPATLASDYAAMAGALDLPEKESRDQELVIDAVRDWLSRHDRWLLVFDNAIDPDDLHRYLPRESTGQVLVTSRNTAWKTSAQQLHIEVFAREDSVRFLLQRAGQSIVDPNAYESIEERESANSLAKELGDLPLALELAASYCRATRTTIRNYLHQFLESTQFIHEAVDRAVQLSLEKARNQSPHCDALLNLCSCLAPDDLPLDLLLDGAGQIERLPELIPLEDEENRQHALAALCQYSLIERSQEKYSIHRLVQKVVFDKIEAKACDWVTTSLRLIDVNLASDVQSNIASWPVYARLLTHALAVTEHAEQVDFKDNKLPQVLNKLGIYMLVHAQFAQAEPLMRRALAIDERSYGPEHPRVAIDLNNLASLLKATNRMSEAEPLMRRALAIDERSYGPEHPDVAIALNNLASLLQETNRMSEAEPLMRRALAIDELSYGNEHPDVATDLNNLASLLQETNRMSEAEPLMRRALAIDERSYGNEHPNVARDLNNLALLLKATNRMSEAEPLMRRALAIDELSYGNEHPNVARDLNNLALLLQETNRMSEAEPLMRRALAISQTSLGGNHPKTQVVADNYAKLLKEVTSPASNVDAVMIDQ